MVPRTEYSGAKVDNNWGHEQAKQQQKKLVSKANPGKMLESQTRCHIGYVFL